MHIVLYCYSNFEASITRWLFYNTNKSPSKSGAQALQALWLPHH